MSGGPGGEWSQVCARCKTWLPAPQFAPSRCEGCITEIERQVDEWATEAARYIVLQMAEEVA